MPDDFRNELTEKQEESLRSMRRIANVGICPGIDMWYVKGDYIRPHKFHITTVKFEDSGVKFKGEENFPQEEYDRYWCCQSTKSLTEKALGKTLFFSYAAALNKLGENN